MSAKIRGIFWVLVTVILLAEFGLYFYNENDSLEILPKPMVLDLVVPGYFVKTPGCRIPKLNPFDKSILPYYKRSSHVKCGGKRILVESNQTSIWIVKDALIDYIKNGSLSCCYQPYRRKTPKNNKWDTSIDKGFEDVEGCIQFKESANIHHEFIKVACTHNGSNVYTDYHAFVVPKTPFDSESHEKTDTSMGVSMLVIGMDSVSRANFYRQMPKLTKFLNSLKVFDFAGYNKVHDNTFPNMVPALSGFSVTDLKHMCWFRQKSHFDNCPWIWKKLSANGYLTAFGEDSSWTGIFSYLKSGFLYQPTDYYLRPFIKRAEDETQPKPGYCITNKFTTDILMNYAARFAKNMTNTGKKFWGFFFGSSLTHDYLNAPPNTDDIYLELFTELNRSSVLNTTVVFFLSDHGMRWGKVRETYQGRMEERLPFLFILIPDWLRKKYPKAMRNMEKNTHFLTTPFDVHETMTDLMNLPDLEKPLEKTEETMRSGVSLFREIPLERTCSDAGITSEWCTCHQATKINETDKNVVQAATVLIGHINDLLANHTECARLHLKNVLSARHDAVGGNSIKKDTKEQIADYILSVQTEPGGGKFEGVVRHKSNSMFVQGYVERINAYGKQGWCIDRYDLRLYCYCS